MREIMMTRLWRKNTIEEVAKRKCGPHIQKCMQDIQADLGFVAPSDMKAQINIRMTKIASRDPPPHYPIQDIPLMKQLVLGLSHTEDSAIKERWNTNPRIKIFLLVDSHSDFERLQDDSDCII
jgi:hypothetical protein